MKNTDPMSKVSPTSDLALAEEARRAAYAKASDGAPVFLVKKYQESQGTDGIAYSGELWVNGERAAFVIQEGNGGMLRIDWSRGKGARFHGGPMFDLVAAYAARIPPYEAYRMTMTEDVEGVVSNAFNDHAERKQFERLIRRNEVPFIVGDSLCSYKGLFTATARASILSKHGDRVRFGHEELGYKPLKLPPEAEAWIPTALRGQVVAMVNGKWTGFKAPDSESTRASVRKLYGQDTVFLADLIQQARSVEPARAKSA